MNTGTLTRPENERSERWFVGSIPALGVGRIAESG